MNIIAKPVITVKGLSFLAILVIFLTSPASAEAIPPLQQRFTRNSNQPLDSTPDDLKKKIDEYIRETREALEGLREGRAAAQIGGDPTLAGYLEATIIKTEKLLASLNRLRRDFDPILKAEGEEGIDQRLLQIRNNVTEIKDNYLPRVIRQMRSDLKWVWGEEDRKLREEITKAEKEREGLARKAAEAQRLIDGTIIKPLAPSSVTTPNSPPPRLIKPTPAPENDLNNVDYLKRLLRAYEAEQRRLRRQEFQMRVLYQRFEEDTFLEGAEETRERMERLQTTTDQLRSRIEELEGPPYAPPQNPPPTSSRNPTSSLNPRPNPRPPPQQNPNDSLEARIRNLIDAYNRANPSRPVRYTNVEIIPSGNGAIVRIYTGRNSFSFFNYYSGMSDGAILREILRARNY